MIGTAEQEAESLSWVEYAIEISQSPLTKDTCGCLEFTITFKLSLSELSLFLDMSGITTSPLLPGLMHMTTQGTQKSLPGMGICEI